MRYYLTIMLILLIITSVVGAEIPENGPNKEKFYPNKPIKPIPVNLTNITLNITDPINITWNITDLTNITELNITDFNFTENNTEINLTINISEMNFTDFNQTLNLTGFNTTVNETNESRINLTLFNESALFSPLERNGKTTSYFYVGNTQIAKISEDNLDYMHNDRLDTLRLTTEINGDNIGEIKTLPSGKEILNTNQERFTFTGKELDGDLYSVGIRYYSPELGKFTSTDPVEDGHKYNYVNNNPLRFTDPTGMTGKDKNQNIILNSRAIPIKQTPLVLTFTTQKDVEAYKKNIADPFIAAANADTTGAQLYLSTGNGRPLSIPNVGESNIYPFIEANMIEPLLAMEVRQDGPVENIVLMAHRNEADHTQLVLRDITTNMDTTTQMSELQTRVLGLPKNYFASNAQMIFAICGADSCIDGQAIADSLGITTYLTSEKVEYVEGMNPMLIYGQFNEYTPKQEIK